MLNIKKLSLVVLVALTSNVYADEQPKTCINVSNNVVICNSATPTLTIIKTEEVKVEKK